MESWDEQDWDLIETKRRERHHSFYCLPKFCQLPGAVRRHVHRITLTYNYNLFHFTVPPCSLHLTPSFSPPMSFARHLVSPVNNTQHNSGTTVSNVESMFTQIMEVVLKSVSAP